MGLVTASGDPLDCPGTVKIPVQAGELSFTWPFYEISNLDSQGLAGVDLLRFINADINWESNTVTPGKPPEQIALIATQNMDINGDSAKVVKVKAMEHGSDSPQRGMTGVCSAHPDVLHEGIVQTDRDGYTYVSVPNHFAETRSVKKGEILGSFFPLDKKDLKDPATAVDAAIKVAPVSQAPVGSARSAVPSRGTEERQAILRRLLKISAPHSHQAQYQKLLLEFHDVFSLDETDLGKANTYQHDIQLTTDEPVHVKQFRIPLAQKEFIQDRLKQLAELRLIEPSVSPYNTPMFAVPKKGLPGEPIKYRLIQDLRALNAVTKKDKHSIMDVRTCLDRIGERGATVFSSVDLRSGYYQMGLTDESKPYTAFTMPPFGKWQWTVTTMGLTGAPASFCKLMEDVMKDLEQVLLYLDDLLCASRTHDEHLRELRQCLVRLRKVGLKINPEKSEFGSASVEYLGHTVTGEGFTVGEHKFHAIQNFPEPTTVKKVRMFLGLASFFRQLIPSFQADAGHLSALLKPDSTWKSGPLPPRAKHAFISLREKLLQRPVVAFPDTEEPFTLTTDAALGDDRNPGGLGAVLTQKIDGHHRVIAYAARSLKDFEKRYGAFNLELKAVSWAIEHFSCYLKSRHFTVVTDHKPVVNLSTAQMKHLHKFHELLLQYPCEVIYKPGEDNVVADALSRNPPDVGPVGAINLISDTIREAQEAIPDWANIIKALQAGADMTKISIPPEFYRQARRLTLAEDDLLALKDPKGMYNNKVIVMPPALREQALLEGHAARLAGHKGLTKTTATMVARFWWPHMHSDIATFVRTCPVCQKTKNPSRFPSSQPSLHPIETCTAPNQRIHADLFGPLKTSEAGNQYILTMTDAFSKFVRLVAIPDKTATTVARAIFTHWISIFGPMALLITDQGKEFMNETLRCILTLYDVRYNTTSAIAPSVNGQAEIFNKTIAGYLKAYLAKGDAWEELLAPMMMAYNSAVHTATGEAPAYVTFAQQPRAPQLDPVQPTTAPNQWCQRQQHLQQTVWPKVHGKIERSAEKMMDQQKPSTNFSPDQFEVVYIYYPTTAQTDTSTNPKLIPQWRKAVILAKLGGISYYAKALEGSGRTTIVRTGRMKPCHPRTYMSAKQAQFSPTPKQKRKAAVQSAVIQSIRAAHSRSRTPGQFYIELCAITQELNDIFPNPTPDIYSFTRGSKSKSRKVDPQDTSWMGELPLQRRQPAHAAWPTEEELFPDGWFGEFHSAASSDASTELADPDTPKPPIPGRNTHRLAPPAPPKGARPKSARPPPPAAAAGAHSPLPFPVRKRTTGHKNRPVSMLLPQSPPTHQSFSTPSQQPSVRTARKNFSPSPGRPPHAPSHWEPAAGAAAAPTPPPRGESLQGQKQAPSVMDHLSRIGLSVQNVLTGSRTSRSKSVDYRERSSSSSDTTSGSDSQAHTPGGSSARGRSFFRPKKKLPRK